MSNRTKKQIAQATKDLLREKPLNKITIKEITEKCELSRNSFYYHFADIYEVVNWIFEDEIDALMQKYASDQNFGDGFLQGIMFLYENKEMMLHIYKTMQRENVDLYLSKMIDNVIITLIDSIDNTGKYTAESHKITALYYRSAFVGVIQHWLSTDMSTPPEQIAVLCDEVFRGTAITSLEAADRALTNLGIDKILQ